MTEEEIINNRVFCLRDNNGVVGEITERNKFYIEVEIILPYKGWSSGLSISGPCRRTPHHFLTKHGDEVAQELLKESYDKLHFLNKNIDWIVKMYYSLQKNIEMINGTESLEGRERIVWILEEWFWTYSLFDSNRTGLRASFPDHKQLIEIFRVYRKTGKKAFL